MTELILALIGAAFGLTTLILKRLWSKEKTKTQLVKERALAAAKASEKFRRKLVDGKADEAISDLYSISRNIHALLRETNGYPKG